MFYDQEENDFWLLLSHFSPGKTTTKVLSCTLGLWGLEHSSRRFGNFCGVGVPEDFENHLIGGNGGSSFHKLTG